MVKIGKKQTLLGCVVYLLGIAVGIGLSFIVLSLPVFHSRITLIVYSAVSLLLCLALIASTLFVPSKRNFKKFLLGFFAGCTVSIFVKP